MNTHPYEAEFDRIYMHKKATEMLIERIFKPKKYPEFHAYLDWLHERWIAAVTRVTPNCGGSNET